MEKFEQLARQASISALYIKPKKELHGDYWIKVCSDLPNTTTCVKLTSAKAKIRMLRDGKLVKHKSNRDNDQNIKTRKHPCERAKSWQTMTHWMNKHELKRWHVFEKKKKKNNIQHSSTENASSLIQKDKYKWKKKERTQ